MPKCEIASVCKKKKKSLLWKESNIGLGCPEIWRILLQCTYSRLGLAGHWIALYYFLLPTESWTRWSSEVALNLDFSITLIWKIASGTSSFPILFSFVKLFSLLIIIKILLWLHPKCIMSSNSEVENGFWYKYTEEKVIKRKISTFSLDKKSLEFPSGTLFPAIFLSVMIHGTRQRPNN